MSWGPPSGLPRPAEAGPDDCNAWRCGAFGSGQTIFDVFGLFPDGRFGFYNYSQSQVTYQGLTEEDTPPSPVPVPEPTSVVLLATGLATAALRRRRKSTGA